MAMDSAGGESAFLEPEKIVQFFGLKKGDHIADFGVGHGYFAIALARAAGGDGKVYAIDIQKPALDIVRAKAASEHLLNLEYIWGDLDMPQGSHLKDRFCDFVLIASVLFQAEKKLAVVQEAYRVLREGGRLALIEWSGAADAQSWEVSPASEAAHSLTAPADGARDSFSGAAHRLGPRPELWIKKENARALALQAGFAFDREFATGSHHYGLLFVKK